jgi:hypothetical protein
VRRRSLQRVGRPPRSLDGSRAARPRAVVSVQLPRRAGRRGRSEEFPPRQRARPLRRGSALGRHLPPMSTNAGRGRRVQWLRDTRPTRSPQRQSCYPQAACAEAAPTPGESEPLSRPRARHPFWHAHAASAASGRAYGLPVRDRKAPVVAEQPRRPGGDGVAERRTADRSRLRREGSPRGTRRSRLRSSPWRRCDARKTSAMPRCERRDSPAIGAAPGGRRGRCRRRRAGRRFRTRSDSH